MATKKAISAPAPVKGKTTRKTVTKDIPAAAPTRPRQFSEDLRRIPHYTLVSNGQYLHQDTDTDSPNFGLSPTVRNAYVTTDFAGVRLTQRQANEHIGEWGRAWKFGKLELHVVDVEFNGFVTGSHPWHCDDDNAPILSRPMSTRFRNSRVNSALAQAADVEEDHLEVISYIHTALTFSPMFAVLVNEYKESLKQPDGLEPDFYLCELASRAFYAGVVAGRREQGQRNENGQLLLDEALTKAKGAITPQGASDAN